MKTTRAWLGSFFAVVALAAGLPLGASGPTIQFFVIGKEKRFDQTNTSTVTPTALNPGQGQYPWRIFADVNGSGLDASNPASLLTNVVAATNSPTPPNTGLFAIAWDNFENRWKFRNGAGSQAGLDAAYPSGNYDVSLDGGATTAFTLPMGTTNHYPNTPIATLTGGNWVGGVYQFNPGNVLTIDSGTYGTDFQWDTARIEINIDGNSFSFQADKGVGSATAFLNTDTSGIISASSTAMPTFVAGQTYNVDISYNYATYFGDISSAFGQSPGTATGVTIFGATTSFTIQAIPEPSTYALIGGLAALAGVMLHRRRRLA